MAGLCLLLLICHLSSSVLSVLQSPENVTIRSANFQHILTWEDTNNNSVIRYRVHYNKFGNPGWAQVPTCTKINKQHCDLTDYFSDLKGFYNARVVSFTRNETSNATTSARFCPVSHTILGPPLVNLSVQGCNVTINIRPPISYFKGTPSMLHNDVYPLITYGIDQWLNNMNLSALDETVYRDNYTLMESLLSPNSNYCVSVKVSLTSLNTRDKKIPSALQCVTTKSAQTEDSQAPYVVIAVSILFLIAIVCVLIALNRAGYICMGWNFFFPKVLKSFPPSMSMDGHKEYVCPAQIVSVEILNNTEKEECNDSDEEMCGQGYAARKKLLDSAQNDSISTLQTSAPSSTNESNLHESCASDLELPQAVTPSPCPMLINTPKVFKISLNSVFVGNPEDLWTNFKKEVPPKEHVDIRTMDVPEVPPDPHDLRLITNILNLGACRASVLKECSPAESSASDDSDADSGAEEMERPFASDYMSR
ncbi:hypothetical protein XELAEV_18011493mg [Xenopus laevis]|uniref:Fibronectin type-III domain-containing protein n=1 Tax=Xenopus laevis TaxID=8355 RepID=A0A974DNF4_XENLA|nr:hypothetical protein XELAEV_18011493mg [Xenopus laevis]